MEDFVKRVQRIQVTLKGDAPNAVRKLGECKQVVSRGVKHYKLVVPNDDTGWAAIQIARAHCVQEQGTFAGCVMIRAEATLGVNVDDVDPVPLHDGENPAATSDDWYARSLAEAREAMDRHAEEIECKIPIDAFTTTNADYVKELLESVTAAEEREDDEAKLARRKSEAWGAIRRQLSERWVGLERQAQRELTLSEAKAAAIVTGAGSAPAPTPASADAPAQTPVTATQDPPAATPAADGEDPWPPPVE